MKVYNVTGTAIAVIECGVAGVNLINGILMQLTTLKKAGEAKSIKDVGKTLLYEGVAIAIIGAGAAGMWIGVNDAKLACITKEINIENN